MTLRGSFETMLGGKVVLHVFAVVAEFERDTTPEWAMASLEAAKSRRRGVGRPTALDEVKAKLAGRLKD